jgi:formamidopyrimidine-DNA glycosylase
MPELPEVETIKETLRHRILGKTIAKVDVTAPRLVVGMSTTEFCLRLAGQTVQEIERRGKYLIFKLTGNDLVTHLRMEGRFFLKSLEAPREKHEHICIYLTDQTTMRYHDTRKFGTFEIAPKDQGTKVKGIAKLGPEPQDTEFNSAYLRARLSRSSRAIKTLLLDQTVVAGLGNIYVDEVLFQSKIHPERPGNSLGTTDIDAIIDSSRSVLGAAIAAGGTSIRTYVSSLGVSGRFQTKLNVHTLAGKPCTTCQTPIIKIRVGSRGTYLCPNCQK